MNHLADVSTGIVGILGGLAAALLAGALLYAVVALLLRGRVVACLLVVGGAIGALTPTGSWLVWGICSAVLAVQAAAYALFTVRGLLFRGRGSHPRAAGRCHE